MELNDIPLVNLIKHLNGGPKPAVSTPTPSHQAEAANHPNDNPETAQTYSDDYTNEMMLLNFNLFDE